MLNISPNRINAHVNEEVYASLQEVESTKSGRGLIRVSTFFLCLFVVTLFLPWTQNIPAKGKVTTLKPGQRPQTIHSVIPGRIESWYVQEGDLVEKGDTILFISEVKPEYFDPQLLPRTQAQLKAKESSVVSYKDKVIALGDQIRALEQTAGLKLEQTRNKLKQSNLKVTSDSIDFEAYKINYKIAIDQFKRAESLYEKGLKSLTELENKRLKVQKAQAEMISGENKLLTSKNEVLNARVELTSIQAQYRKDIAKAQSDKYTALTSQYDAEATVNKMQTQYTSYSVRSGLYYITAPQSGYITKAIQSGIGETIKEGVGIVSIMPAKYDLAIEIYVKPLDLPLLEKGQDIRIQFDGWPAIIFSGWPNTSYGTYGGEVFAIDNFISNNGKYRVLVAPDPDDHAWPTALRVGSGAQSMILLKDVAIWYELWRQINGFPPDYYKTQEIDNPGESKDNGKSKK